jgi:ubiquinone/menaquinone biosynthesis C-methylase UbiE
MKKDNIQIQWNNAAEAWVDFVRSGKDWTRNELNNPAMFKMLGKIRGKKILDLCCGEGYNTRIMTRKGAKVTGVDFSEELIQLAVEEEKKKRLGIKYIVSDAAEMHKLKSNSFDIVASFMAFQDIKNYRGAVRETSRVLKKHGRFVFVIPHPCFEIRILDGKRVGGWVYEKNDRTIDGTPFWTEGKTTDDALYYTVDKYFDTCSEVIQWKMERLTKHFETTSFHRTLTDYADALHSTGLLIARLNEPKPTKKGLIEHPEYFEGNLRIPQSLIIEAVKMEIK